MKICFQLGQAGGGLSLLKSYFVLYSIYYLYLLSRSYVQKGVACGCRIITCVCSDSAPEQKRRSSGTHTNYNMCG